MIVATGFAITAESNTRYYAVRVWERHNDGHGAAHTDTQDYEHLSYTEVVDVVLAILDERRPGYVVGNGWTQAPLW